VIKMIQTEEIGRHIMGCHDRFLIIPDVLACPQKWGKPGSE
jgi:hypothetical protein